MGSRLSSAAMSESTFLFVKIPGSYSPMERGERFEDPLDDALREAEAGEVTGGGTSLGGDPFSGVDVEATDLEQALEIIRRVLIERGAPAGTVIEEGETEHPVWAS